MSVGLINVFLITILLLPTIVLSAKVDGILQQSKTLINEINTLFGEDIKLLLDDQTQCERFNEFMDYRPHGYEFKDDNSKIVIICSEFIENLVESYPLEQVYDFNLFLLAHELVHLVYGPQEVDDRITQHIEDVFGIDNDKDISTYNLQHLNIDILALKILIHLGYNVQKFSNIFLDTPNAIGLHIDDETLPKRFMYRNYYVTSSFNNPSSKWDEFIWVDSLCERQGLFLGLKKMGIQYYDYCFEYPNEEIDIKIEKSFEDYIDY